MFTTDLDLTAELYRLGVIQLGEFTLKSGQISPIYMDLRKIISFPVLLRDIANSMWKCVSACQFDVVCGVPYTALPIATCLSLDHDVAMVMRRKEKKDYGTKQKIEGVFTVGQTCLIIEDVITTGGSILETAADIEAAGLIVRDVVVFIDREQGGNNNLQPKNFQLHAVYTMTHILKNLLATAILPPAETSIVQRILMEKTA